MSTNFAALAHTIARALPENQSAHRLLYGVAISRRAESQSRDELAALAAKPNLDAEVAQKLREHPHNNVRAEYWKHAELTDDAIALLENEPSAVRDAVLTRTDLDEETLRKLCTPMRVGTAGKLIRNTDAEFPADLVIEALKVVWRNPSKRQTGPAVQATIAALSRPAVATLAAQDAELLGRMRLYALSHAKFTTAEKVDKLDEILTHIREQEQNDAAGSGYAAVEDLPVHWAVTTIAEDCQAVSVRTLRIFEDYASAFPSPAMQKTIRMVRRRYEQLATATLDSLVTCPNSAELEAMLDVLPETAFHGPDAATGAAKVLVSEVCSEKVFDRLTPLLPDSSPKALAALIADSNLRTMPGIVGPRWIGRYAETVVAYARKTRIYNALALLPEDPAERARAGDLLLDVALEMSDENSQHTALERMMTFAGLLSEEAQARVPVKSLMKMTSHSNHDLRTAALAQLAKMALALDSEDLDSIPMTAELFDSLVTENPSLTDLDNVLHAILN